jgi:hypothetical protein
MQNNVLHARLHAIDGDGLRGEVLSNFLNNQLKISLIEVQKRLTC